MPECVCVSRGSQCCFDWAQVQYQEVHLWFVVQGAREGPAQLGRETGLASSSAQFGRLYGAMSYFGAGARASGAVTLNGIILRSWVAVHVQAIWSWSSNGVRAPGVAFQGNGHGPAVGTGRCCQILRGLLWPGAIQNLSTIKLIVAQTIGGIVAN